MAKEDHLKILRRGINDWNLWREQEPITHPDLSGAILTYAEMSQIDLNYADLSGADFTNAYLNRAEFYQAKINYTNLRRANISQAYMREAVVNYANLTKADLSSSDLRRAHLNCTILIEADLSRCQLMDSELSDAKLENAKLTDADLSNAVLSNANLRNADLSNTNLTNARFISCDLTDALVEDALVTNIQIQNLRGLPKPPGRLRSGTEEDVILIEGEDARNFFLLPIIIEVHFNQVLSEHVIGCYHFHLEDLYRHKISDIRFVGYRKEEKSTALRFQCASYNSLYRRLPDLMAPFPAFAHVDWDHVLQNAPQVQKENPKELPPPSESIHQKEPKRWLIAEHMAAFFRACRQAEPFKIIHGFNRVIDIPTKQPADKPNPIQEADITDIDVVPEEEDPAITEIDFLGLDFSYDNEITQIDLRLAEEEPEEEEAPTGVMDILKSLIDEADIDTELEALLCRLLELFEELSEEHDPETLQELEDHLKCLVREAIQPQPRKHWYAFGARGLMEEAEAFGAIGDAMITTTQAVLDKLIRLAYTYQV